MPDDEFDIQTRFVSRDPQWDVLYTEKTPDGETRRAVAYLRPGALEVGRLEHWSESDIPMDEDARQRVLERLTTWAFTKAPVQVDEIYASGREPVRKRR